MDYNTIIDRLEGGAYLDLITSDDVSRANENTTMEEILVHVLCDIERVTHNCQLYNKKGSSIYRIGDVHAKKWSAYFHEYISPKLPENVERDLNLFRHNCRLERYGESPSKWGRRLKHERNIGTLSTPSPGRRTHIVTQSGKRKALVELEEDFENDNEEDEEDDEDVHEVDEDDEFHKRPTKHKQGESHAEYSSALIFTDNQMR